MWRHVKIVSTRSVRTITTYCMDICLPNYLETKWSLHDMFIGQPLILRFEEVVSNITPALWQSNMGKSWKITKYSDMFPIQTSVFFAHTCMYIYIYPSVIFLGFRHLWFLATRFSPFFPFFLPLKVGASWAPCSSSASSAPLRSARRAVPCFVATWHRLWAWDADGPPAPTGS